MSTDANPKNELAIGTDVMTVKHDENVTIRCYLVDRPAHTPALRAAETGMDVLITLPHPRRKVWPVFKDFNLWMNRYGFTWDSGVPADNEDRFVYLGHKGPTATWKYEDARTRYVVRKVIEEQLIYFDSPPIPTINKKAVWSGHNLVSLREAQGNTHISFFMEHTWYSETMTIEELRAEACGVTFDSGVAFWREYFIPDLISLVNTGRVIAS